MKIIFDFNAQRKKFYLKKRLLNDTKRILKKFFKNSKIFYLSVFLVSSSKIKNLNKKYRKINKSTTVLSFPQDEPLKNKKNDEKIVLGDIFLCPKEIRKREEKIDFFFKHGLLHLLGLSHKDMEKYEDL